MARFIIVLALLAVAAESRPQFYGPPPGARPPFGVGPPPGRRPPFGAGPRPGGRPPFGAGSLPGGRPSFGAGSPPGGRPFFGGRPSGFPVLPPPQRPGSPFPATFVDNGRLTNPNQGQTQAQQQPTVTSPGAAQTTGNTVNTVATTTGLASNQSTVFTGDNANTNPADDTKISTVTGLGNFVQSGISVAQSGFQAGNNAVQNGFQSGANAVRSGTPESVNAARTPVQL